MRNIIAILFLLSLNIGCRATNELYLRKDFLEREIKTIEGGSDSNYRLETLKTVLEYTKSELEYKPKCPPGPRPGTGPLNTDSLVPFQVKKISLPANAKITGTLSDSLISLGNDKCMGGPIYKLNPSVKRTLPLQILVKIQGDTTFNFKYPLTISKKINH